MGKYSIDETTLTSAADAIREKTGGTDVIDPVDFPSKVDEVFAAGKKTEEAERWRNGIENVSSAIGLFSGRSWNDQTFKPQTNIVLKGSANNCFYNCGVTDLDSAMKESGFTLDTSGVTSTVAFSSYARITNFPRLDFTGCSKLQQTFTSHSALLSATIVLAAKTTYTSVFTGCTNLVDLIVEGTIGQNGFDASPCESLSADSGESIINALSTTTTGLTVTLPLAWSETFMNKYDATTYSDLIASRANWTISLV